VRAVLVHSLFDESLRIRRAFRSNLPASLDRAGCPRIRRLRAELTQTREKKWNIVSHISLSNFQRASSRNALAFMVPPGLSPLLLPLLPLRSGSLGSRRD
jgi:hypothetical protein